MKNTKLKFERRVKNARKTMKVARWRTSINHFSTDWTRAQVIVENFAPGAVERIVANAVKDDDKTSSSPSAHENGKTPMTAFVNSDNFLRFLSRTDFKRQRRPCEQLRLGRTPTTTKSQENQSHFLIIIRDKQRSHVAT